MTDQVNDTAVSRQGKSYVVKTYGCQMNEHDSERISGLLEADGMNRVDDVADAADTIPYEILTGFSERVPRR